MSTGFEWEQITECRDYFASEDSLIGTWKNCHFAENRQNRITISRSDCGKYGYSVAYAIMDEGAGEPERCALDADRCIYNSEQLAISAAVATMRDALWRVAKRRRDPSAKKQIKGLVSHLDGFEEWCAPKHEQLSLF